MGQALEMDLWGPPQLAHCTLMWVHNRALLHFVREGQWQSRTGWLPAHRAHLRAVESESRGHALATWPNFWQWKHWIAGGTNFDTLHITPQTDRDSQIMRSAC